MRLDIELLHAVIVICDAGILTAASLRLHRSQSAVSEQMRKLEEACGRVLLLRAKVAVSPRPAGERLLAHAPVHRPVRDRLSVRSRCRDRWRGAARDHRLFPPR
ncbi:LysR family transcriptional regulator [Bradyrhizobium valentinum]|uniref:LysR family transcriptional regulator n=1 Tax=Bradyrhizobium valentinum TaxID=1518501 RepID=UPI001FD9347C|nr:LysR family transcriptional regulator [Bradyrhizobium valentinum]